MSKFILPERYTVESNGHMSLERPYPYVILRKDGRLTWVVAVAGTRWGAMRAVRKDIRKEKHHVQA